MISWEERSGKLEKLIIIISSISTTAWKCGLEAAAVHVVICLGLSPRFRFGCRRVNGSPILARGGSQRRRLPAGVGSTKGF